jgi:hypothetical protein
MKSSDYITQALRTESVRPFDNTEHGRRASRLAHAAFGVVTEIGELAMSKCDPTNFAEELGDICWYLAILADEFQFTLTPMAGITPDFSFGPSVDDLCDQAKRVWFYNQPASVEKIEFAAKAILGGIELLDSRYGGRDGLAPVFQANIAKLQTRFPNKFSEAGAVIRDTDKERMVIEGAFKASGGSGGSSVTA